jgi:hypothetical protein
VEQFSAFYVEQLRQLVLNVSLIAGASFFRATLLWVHEVNKSIIIIIIGGYECFFSKSQATCLRIPSTVSGRTFASYIYVLSWIGSS